MKIYLLSLGCDKNRVDSEKALAPVLEKGHMLAQDPAEADVLVVNTCCFIEQATEESIDAILSLAEYKKESPKELIVMGCLAERYRAQLLDEIPEIDALLGTSDFHTLAARFPEEGPVEGFSGCWLTTPSHYAYLKIAEGCDNRCTYCVIPSIRGAYVSVPMERILAEAGALAANGVQELIVIAQDTTRYGEDLYGQKKLPELLHRLSEIEGIRWIRLLYAYPESVTDDLIAEMASNDKIVKYIDMPIQHSADSVLQRMGRRTSRAEIKDTIRRIRAAHPDFAIRTTLITGFPGETDEDFQELYDFVAEEAFERLGVFPYSREEGTPAYRLPDQIGQEQKERRAEGIMALQQDIHFDRNDKMVGRELTVLIDSEDEEAFTARTWADAPDVDGTVLLKKPADVSVGDFVQVQIVAAQGYDLLGRPIE